MMSMPPVNGCWFPDAGARAGKMPAHRLGGPAAGAQRAGCGGPSELIQAFMPLRGASGAPSCVS